MIFFSCTIIFFLLYLPILNRWVLSDYAPDNKLVVGAHALRYTISWHTFEPPHKI